MGARGGFGGGFSDGYVGGGMYICLNRFKGSVPLEYAVGYLGRDGQDGAGIIRSTNNSGEFEYSYDQSGNANLAGTGGSGTETIVSCDSLYIKASGGKGGSAAFIKFTNKPTPPPGIIVPPPTGSSYDLVLPIIGNSGAITTSAEVLSLGNTGIRPPPFVGTGANIFIASSQLYISTVERFSRVVNSRSFDILAGQTAIVTLFAQAWDTGRDPILNPVFLGSAIMFLYKYTANGTLTLTNKDATSSCSAIMRENSLTTSVRVTTNKTNVLSEAIIVDPNRYVKKLWTTPPKNPNTNVVIPYYYAIQDDLFTKVIISEPNTDTGGYWECSIWDSSIMGNLTTE
jgi:hypothetical protein